MSQELFDYCIIGAGPSGLTAAYQLLKAGKSVLLIERDSRVGGLAKSFHYDGHIFDTGPKRFHTDDPIVLDFIQEIVQGDIVPIGRSTEVFFLDKYFHWPLRTQDLLCMPLNVTARCAMELLKDRPIVDKASFQEYIVAKYGKTLYSLFFKPYTNKFLRWDPSEIHSDWASTGINRTVIDKRVSANSSMDLFKSLVLPGKVETKFLYPSHGGFGGFYEQLLLLCQKNPGFELMLSQTIKQLKDNGHRLEAVTQSGVGVAFKELIWTGNLNALCALTEHSSQQVHYLNTVFYNIICKEEDVLRKSAQWVYVSQGESLISRITCMKEFAPYTCKKGYYNLICELTDSQKNPVYFSHPEKYSDGILGELKNMRFIKNTGAVEGVHIQPVKDTYPIYHRRYLNDFGKAAASIRRFSRRIHLLGRSGAFWYNNSDHSIRFAIEMARKLVQGGPAEFNYRDYFGGHTAASKAGATTGEQA